MLSSRVSFIPEANLVEAKCAVIPLLTAYLSGMELAAYFDDSNSHKDAPLIMWAGFVGYENQWRLFEEKWLSILAKENLPYFSRAELEFRPGNSPLGRIDPSGAWKDGLLFELRQAIFNAGLFGIAAAVPRAHWNKLVSEKDEQWLNPPGTVSVILISAKTTAFAADRSYHRPIKLFFDGGIEPIGRQTILEIGEITNNHQNRSDIYVFAEVKKTPALQAADLFAWELQNDMKSYLTEGGNRQVSPHMRPWFERPCDIEFLEKKILAARLAMPEFQNVQKDDNWAKDGQPKA